ncbi:MAG TPA: thermonuclease family protein [Cyclobacteriaceae bacterium]|nr:thermonuclease family protein [Cyclobacteriaceae bacterium]
MRHFLIFLVGALLFAPSRANSVKIMGTVTTVVDGNTLEVNTSEGPMKILLYGIDCPELGQAYGDAAKARLEKLLLNRQVTVDLVSRDRRGNHYGLVFTEVGEDPRIDLLREGLAWTVEDGSSAELEPYRSFAQQKRRGLWQDSKPKPPWVFRREQSMLQPKGR